jgi:GT2 family glycosyltransferase/SAM-dependent methyltransferase
MPVEEDISKAYPATYYTHASELGKGLPRRLYDAIGDGYLQRRYGYRHGVGSRWLRYLSLLSWLYPAADPEFGVTAMYLPARQDGARLLDVGCGSGESLARMQRLGWDVQGVDVDPSAVATARAIGVPVHLGDLASARYPDNTFDAIHVSHVVEHVHDPVGLLRECRRILKVGGTLVVLTPNVDSWGHRRFGRAWHGLDAPRHLMLFRRETLAQVASAAGLQVRRLTTTSRGATSAWLRSNQLRRGGPITLAEITGARPWLSALPYQSAEQWLLRFKPEIGEELCLIASKTSDPATDGLRVAHREGDPKISVIVLAYNSAAFVREAVDSLLADRASADAVEVIVMDNASEDETTATLRLHYDGVQGIRLLRTDIGLGYAGGNNQAAKFATGDILLFLNDDCALEPGCLSSMRDEFLKDETLGILQCALATRDGSRWDALGTTMDSWGLLQARGEGTERARLQPGLEKVFAAKGAALAIRHSLFEQLSGFDETLWFLFEDTDLSWRALLAGTGVAVSGHAVVRHRQLARYHSPGAKLEGSAWYLLTRNRIRCMLKNFSPGWLLSSGAVHLLLLGAYAFRETCRGHPSRAHDVVRALWWNVMQLPSTLRLRRRIQGSRVVTDGQLVTSGSLARGRPGNVTRSPMW